MPDVSVPNQFPAQEPGSARLAIVGEAPAVEETSWSVCSQGHGFGARHWQDRLLVDRAACPRCGSRTFEPRPTPFVGESGRLLDHLLEDAGLPRSHVFVGNVSQVPLGEEEKQLFRCSAGLAQLEKDLAAFQPTCVLVLGNLALAALMGEGHKITNWRGSIFAGRLGTWTGKCVAAMHPAAILREPSELALLRFDVKRAVQEASYDGLHLPRRTIITPTDLGELLGRLRALRARQPDEPLGYDIEGTVDTGITVFSLALTPTVVVSVPLKRLNFASVWSKEDESLILAELGALLADPDVTKVCHNAGYEAFVHRWLHGHSLVNVEDTMLAWHVLYPELLKDLSVVASVLTRQPYWGGPGDWTDDVSRDTYNAIDSATTLEAWAAMQPLLTPAHRDFYQHTRDLIEPCLEMSYEGMAFDRDARDRLVASIQQEVFAFQGELDELAGIKPPTFDDVAAKVAFARKLAECKTWADIVECSKPSFAKPYTPARIDKP